jgi:uncharacterized Zn-binding protein involved in type VI secretion
MPSVARVQKDVGADLLKVTTNKTVFIGDQPWAVATEGTVSVLGDVVVASQTTVYVEDKRIAVKGAMMASGSTVTVMSPDPNVEAGKVGP